MRKLLTLALAAMLVCGALVTGAFAEEEGLYQYEVKADGTARIVYIDSSVEIAEIPAEMDGYKVTSIGGEVSFVGGNLKRVILPDTIQSIEDYAFSNCFNLEAINIPDSVTSIGEGAMTDCRSLDRIRISQDHPYYTYENDMLVSRQDMTLMLYTGMEAKNVEVPAGIKRIGRSAFEDRTASSVTLPDSVTAVGDFAFRGVKGLREISIPDSVKSIGRQTFWGNDSLTAIRIPAGVTEMGYGSFGCCRNLNSITIDPENPVYEMQGNMLVNTEKNLLYYHLDKDEGTVTIPEGIVEIEEDAFEWSEKLKEVIVPDSVKIINSSVFSGCSGMEAIRLPEGLAGIPSYTFFYCTSLKSVTIPESVTAIRYNAFSECYNLDEVIIPSGTTEIMPGAFDEGAKVVVRAPAGSAAQKFCEENGISFEELVSGAEQEPAQEPEQEEVQEPVQEPEQEEVPAELPAGDGESAEAAAPAAGEYVSGPYRYEVKADGTAEIIRVDVNIETAEIPEELDGCRVTSVSPDAFCNCHNLTSVTIPDSVVSMDNEPFLDCDKLASILVSPDHPVYMVENGALINKNSMRLVRFADPANQGAYVVPEGVREIATDAFEAGSLTSVIIPGSVETIGAYPFMDCKNLTTVFIGEGVKKIGSQAFMGCGQLTAVSIPDSLAEIGYAAFSGCSSLKYVQVSQDHPVFEVKDGLLVNKKEKRIITVPCTVEGVVTIPEGIEIIGAMAFQGCREMSGLVIPEGVKAIERNAFDGCWSLEKVTIPDSVTEFGNDMFDRIREKVTVSAGLHSAARKYCSENGIRFRDVNAEKVYEYSVLEDGTAEITGADKGITEALIPEELDGYRVVSIGYGAFMDCDRLKSVEIPEGVKDIGYRAFGNCTELETVNIPDSVVSIGKTAFTACWSLKAIEISPDHPAFAHTNDMLIRKEDGVVVTHTTINVKLCEIPEGTTAIEEEAFNNSRMTYVTIPSDVTTIGSCAFDECRNLLQVVIPVGVKKIESQAFMGCRGLRQIIIPATAWEIGDGVFNNCGELVSIVVDPDNPVYEAQDLLLVNKVKKIIVSASGALKGSFTIPDGIKEIAEVAFQGCDELTRITVPDSVTAIGNAAFNIFNDSLVIIGSAGSAAEKYCRENNIRFEEMK